LYAIFPRSEKRESAGKLKSKEERDWLVDRRENMKRIRKAKKLSRGKYRWEE